jgi:hypothetical protein
MRGLLRRRGERKMEGITARLLVAGPLGAPVLPIGPASLELPTTPQQLGRYLIN